MNKCEKNYRIVNLFGHQLKIGSECFLNSEIQKIIQVKRPDCRFLVHHNLHSLYLYCRNVEVRKAMNKSKLGWIDGWPVTLILRLQGHKIPFHWRSTFLDWQHTFFDQACKPGTRVFLLGAKTKIVNKACKTLQNRQPSLYFRCHPGYWDTSNPVENAAVLNRIAEFNTDILLVGMGMPKQELWLANNIEMIRASVAMPVGGYFDYLGGATYTPPRWTGKVGLEWLFRLIASPKRLGYRYIVEPWFVLFYLTLRLLKPK